MTSLVLFPVFLGEWSVSFEDVNTHDRRRVIVLCDKIPMVFYVDFINGEGH